MSPPVVRTDVVGCVGIVTMRPAVIPAAGDLVDAATALTGGRETIRARERRQAR